MYLAHTLGAHSQHTQHTRHAHDCTRITLDSHTLGRHDLGMTTTTDASNAARATRFDCGLCDAGCACNAPICPNDLRSVTDDEPCTYLGSPVCDEDCARSLAYDDRAAYAYELSRE